MNLAASAVTLDINIAASAVTLDINIASSAVTINVATAAGEHVDTDIVSSITLNVDITAQTVGNIAIDIAAQSVGNVSINIAASAISLNVKTTTGEHVDTDIVSSITLNVDITAQTVGNITIDIAAQTVGNINVNLAASAISLNVKTTTGEHVDSDIVSSIELDVDINAQSVGNLTIDIAAVTHGTIDVDIAAATATVNIATSGGVNIIIDKLTQTAYTPRRTTTSNNGTTASWTDVVSAVRRGKFFPRGCRGFINTIDIYCKDNAATGGTFTVYISPYIGAGYLYSATVTVPAAGAADWRSATFNIMWNYDSLFIFVLGSTGDMHVGWDSGTPYDQYRSLDSGATWGHRDRRLWIRAIMKAETVGDIPVSGTINTVKLPASGGRFKSAAVTLNNNTWTSMLTRDGVGTLVWANIVIPDATAPSSTVVYCIRVYCDGVLAFWEDNRGLCQSITATSGRCGIGYFYQDTSKTYLHIHIPLDYTRHLEIKGRQTTGGNVASCYAYMTTNEIK